MDTYGDWGSLKDWGGSVGWDSGLEDWGSNGLDSDSWGRTFNNGVESID